MGRGIVVALALGVVLTGCGDASSGSAGRATPVVPAASPTAMLPAASPVRAVATVLDDGDGPTICLGGQLDSLPPQCDGPAVAEWDWADHPDAESAGGARWGGYTMVGAWDGTTFTPTDVRLTTPGDYQAEDT
ncbi:MAG TPA: hypothetical protein VGV65_08065 [Nocardioides sp.]|nr:hypothetical protein [Nocardioides sp.]